MEFSYQTGTFTKWLNDLPRGSIGKTAELLYKALQDINRQKMKPSERFRVMETIREPVNYVTENMRTHFAAITIPIPEKTWLIINACRAFYAGMATSYQIIITESRTNPDSLIDNKMFATVMHRILSYIGRGILTAYETYATSHQENWSKLHSIYLQAERADIAQMQVSDELLGIKKKSSIADEYLRVLLLSLTSPYNLQHGEIGKIYYFLASLHELVTLDKILPNNPASVMGMPLVDLTTDYPPELAGAALNHDKLENYRLVNTGRLVDKLREELNLLRNPNSKLSAVTLAGQHEISMDLLRRLIDSWGFLRKRKFNRRQVFTTATVGIGLYNTHQILVQDLPSPQVIKDKTTENDFGRVTKYEIDISDINNVGHDIWASVYPEYGNAPDQQTAESQVPSNKTSKDHPDKQWTLLNQSAEGFALMCVFNCGDKLQVGELVSIRNDSAPPGKRWSVGIIKWLKSYGKNGIELGGQLLAPYAIPIGLTLLKDKADTIPTRGLILPEIPNLNRPSSIICFSRLYRAGDTLKIKKLGQEEQKIQLTHTVGSNNIINQFLYSLVDQRVETAVAQDEPSIEIDVKKFKDVWSSL